MKDKTVNAALRERERACFFYVTETIIDWLIFFPMNKNIYCKVVCSLHQDNIPPNHLHLKYLLDYVLQSVTNVCVYKAAELTGIKMVTKCYI